MTDAPDNLIFVYMRRFDAKFDLVIDEIRELKTRMTLETALANVRTEIAGLHHSYAAIHVELDRVNRRLDLIERRLDLQDVHP